MIYIVDSIHFSREMDDDDQNARNGSTEKDEIILKMMVDEKNTVIIDTVIGVVERIVERSGVKRDVFGNCFSVPYFNPREESLPESIKMKRKTLDDIIDDFVARLSDCGARSIIVRNFSDILAAEYFPLSRSLLETSPDVSKESRAEKIVEIKENKVEFVSKVSRLCNQFKKVVLFNNVSPFKEIVDGKMNECSSYYDFYSTVNLDGYTDFFKLHMSGDDVTRMSVDDMRDLVMKGDR